MKPAAKLLLRAAERMANPVLALTGCCSAIVGTSSTSEEAHKKAEHHFSAMYGRHDTPYWFGQPQYMIHDKRQEQSTRDTRVTALLLASASYEDVA